MKKFKLLTNPIRIKDLESDEWLEIGAELELRIERFRARQERKFRLQE